MVRLSRSRCEARCSINYRVRLEKSEKKKSKKKEKKNITPRERDGRTPSSRDENLRHACTAGEKGGGGFFFLKFCDVDLPPWV